MISIRQLEGRDHYVVPTVMIVVGRFSGSQGPISYSADVLRDSVPYWNGRPVVLYHPSLIHHTFAGHPEVFDRQRIGTVFHTRFDGRRLMCDCWIDCERIQLLDERVADAIRAKRMVEVSTGLVVESGDDDGLALSVQPDHLAILPDQIGACSINDGAGLVRNVAARKRRRVNDRPMSLA